MKELILQNDEATNKLGKDIANEIKLVKKDYPDRAVVVSLMVPCQEECWKSILPKVEETEADGLELNFGCPHGMSERGMGSAVGQVPDILRWLLGGLNLTLECL